MSYYDTTIMTKRHRFERSRWIVAILMMLSTFLCSLNAIPSSQVRGAFYIQCAADPKLAFDIEGFNSNNGKRIWAYPIKGPMKHAREKTTLGGARNQLWIYEPGSKIIKSVMDHSMVIDISGNVNGNAIHSWKRHGGPNQQWEFVPISGDLFAIKCAHKDSSGREKYITFAGEKQQLKMEPKIQGVVTENIPFFGDASVSNQAAGTVVQGWSNKQIFRKKNFPIYYIASNSCKKVLDVSGMKTHNGAPIIAWNPKINDDQKPENQLWYSYPAQNQIISVQSDKAIDSAGGPQNEKIQIWDRIDGNTNQKFEFTPQKNLVAVIMKNRAFTLTNRCADTGMQMKNLDKNNVFQRWRKVKFPAQDSDFNPPEPLSTPTPTPTPQSATTVPSTPVNPLEGSFYIVPNIYNLALEVKSGSDSNGAHIVLNKPCTRGDCKAQLWKYDANQQVLISMLGDGRSGRVIDVSGNPSDSVSNGIRLILWNKHGKSNQQFRFDGDNVRNPSSGKIFTCESGNIGANVKVAPLKTGRSSYKQKFRVVKWPASPSSFEPVMSPPDPKNGYFYIVNSVTGLVMEASGEKNGATIYCRNAQPREQSELQLWIWDPKKPKVLLNFKSHRGMDVDMSSRRSQVWDIHGGPNQQYTMRGDHLVCLAGQNVATAANGNEGAQVDFVARQDDGQNGSLQKWRIVHWPTRPQDVVKPTPIIPARSSLPPVCMCGHGKTGDIVYPVSSQIRLNSFYITSMMGDLVIDIKGMATADGTPVWSWRHKDTDMDNQLWFYNPDGSISSVQSGKNLCVKDNGVEIGICDKTAGITPTSQQWDFVQFSGEIKSRVNGMVITIPNNNQHQGTFLLLQPSSNQIGQKWKKVALGSPDGSFNSPCGSSGSGSGASGFGQPGIGGFEHHPSLSGVHSLGNLVSSGLSGVSSRLTDPLALSLALEPLTKLANNRRPSNAKILCSCNDY